MQPRAEAKQRCICMRMYVLFKKYRRAAIMQSIMEINERAAMLMKLRHYDAAMAAIDVAFDILRKLRPRFESYPDDDDDDDNLKESRAPQLSSLPVWSSSSSASTTSRSVTRSGYHSDVQSIQRTTKRRRLQGPQDEESLFLPSKTARNSTAERNAVEGYCKGHKEDDMVTQREIDEMRIILLFNMATSYYLKAIYIATLITREDEVIKLLRRASELYQCSYRGFDLLQGEEQLC